MKRRRGNFDNPARQPGNGDSWIEMLGRLEFGRIGSATLTSFFSLSFVLSLVFGFLGCAGSSGTPDWVNGATPTDYPKAEYLSALGIGETLSAAQIAAKGELSRIFSADLESEVVLQEQETIVQGNSEQGSVLNVDTRITSDIILEGVEVPLHWRDPRSGEIWVLAVLDRRKECLRVRSEGADLNSELERLLDQIQSTSNPLLSVRSALQARNLGEQLDGLQARSRVLGTQCLESRTAATGDLRSFARESLANLSFIVRAEDIDPRTGASLGSLPQLREQIAGNLTRMGFQVGPSTSANVVPIEAHLRLQRVDRGTSWTEYRWEGSASVGSPVAGDPTAITAESEGAESHPEPSTARLRARRKGELDLSRKLDLRLRAFLAELDGLAQNSR